MVNPLIQSLIDILVTFILILRIKATQGITGLICWIAHINNMEKHLDVGLFSMINR